LTFRGGPSISNFDGVIQQTSCSPTLCAWKPSIYIWDKSYHVCGEQGGGAEPSSSTQSDPTSSHGGTPSSQPLGDANTGNSPSSSGSNRNNSNQGGTNNSNDPQGPAPDRNYLNKLVFTYSTAGGPLQHWGIEGRIRARDVVHFAGPDANLRLRSIRLLLRPGIIERVTNHTHFSYQHNDRARV